MYSTKYRDLLALLIVLGEAESCAKALAEQSPEFRYLRPKLKKYRSFYLRFGPSFVCKIYPSIEIFMLSLSTYSHSIVPGGLLVMSRATRFTPGTSLMIRLLTRSNKS
jgi:hypothetical protein